MRHFKKKSCYIFSPQEANQNVSPGPAVALDEPARVIIMLTVLPTDRPVTLTTVDFNLMRCLPNSQCLTVLGL